MEAGGRHTPLGRPGRHGHHHVRAQEGRPGGRGEGVQGVGELPGRSTEHRHEEHLPGEQLEHGALSPGL